MKLREGAYYRQKNGRILGPAEEHPKSGAYPWKVGGAWYSDGGICIGTLSFLDLIEEVPAPGSEKPAKRALQVGERVRVYGWLETPYGFGEATGTVLDILGAAEIKVALDDVGGGPIVTVHPKQCRRLVKRERRRVWVDPARTICEGDPFSFSPIEGWVEYVEVRRK